MNPRAEFDGVIDGGSANASVMPCIVSDDRHAPTPMIAEKAADSIRRSARTSAASAPIHLESQPA
jgi:hypothetical protein